MSSRDVVGAVALLSVLGMAGTVRAEPILGTVIDYAPSTGVDDARLGASLYLLRTMSDGVTLGGELAGTLGGHMGGWGCRDGGDGTEMVPAVAVFCFEPSAHAHAVVGRALRVGDRQQLRLEVGLGVTGWMLMAGQGGDPRSQITGSGLVRAGWLLRVGDAVGGQWWTGVLVEERAYLAENRPATGSIGWVLEAIVTD